MKVLITMAGLGSRFNKIGIKYPKYKIIANGKSLFEWSMISLKDFFNYEFIFITRDEVLDENFIISKCEELGINDLKVVSLNEITDGQATTAIYADEYVSDSEACIIYNIDTYVKPNAICRNDINDELHGFIPVIRAEGDRWSFVKLNKDGLVEEVAEKKPISNLATIGLYYFKSWAKYKEIYYKMREEIKINSQECYIAPMYNYLLKENVKVGIKILDNDEVSILGTPEEIEEFDKEYLANNL
jgi:dTDP-glucose pyrophosphorylase